MDKTLAKKLRKGTQFHDYVVEQVRLRRRMSEAKFSARHSKWKQDDETFVSYMPERDADRLRRGSRELGGKPEFTTLYIPFDYAVLMSAHTYMTSVFLGRSPPFQYTGWNENSETGALAIETLINYQTVVGRALAPLYIWLMDGAKYGLGVVGNYWCEEQHFVTREVEVPDEFLGVPLGTTHTEIQTMEVAGYKGNKLYNVRPYDFLPDPRVTPANFQQGEFAGRLTNTSWNEVVRKVKAGYFHAANAAYLKEKGNSGGGGEFYNKHSSHIDYPENPQDTLFGSVDGMRSYELCEMYIELIPSEWDLGTSDYPEKWLFCVVDDDCVIGCRPLGDITNKYPFAVIEYEIDGYAMFKRGLMELAKPMTDVITWLVNTHFYNTRKSLNDMFIVDPTRVVMKDVLDPGAGKVIRLKPEAFGTDVRTAITQLPVQTATQGHINDTAVMAQLIQRVTGVNDSIMGMMQGGGRKTATEVRTSSSFGINRLKTVTEWISATGWQDLAMMMVSNSQQYYDASMKIRVAGAQWQFAPEYLQVNPQDIAGQYDFIPVDGTLPVDRYAQVNLWSSLLQQVGQMPQVAAQYDFGKIFAWIAQLGGLKNIDKFKIQIAPPGAMQQQAQAGNVIPLGGAGGNGAARGSTNPRTEGGTRVPPQVRGVGASG
jgi:hypothetical protein